MIKVFLDRLPATGDTVEIIGENHHHLKVVRIMQGEKILLGDELGREYFGEVLSFSKRSCHVRVLEESERNPTVPVSIRLCVGMPKRQKLEDIVFSCTQLGVSEIIPFISSRTVKKKISAGAGKRLRAKALHGAEISKRLDIPLIHSPILYEEAVENFSAVGSSVLFWENSPAEDILKNTEIQRAMTLYIGPEGGFSWDEVWLAREKSLKIRSLGPLVLDVGTASAYSVATVMARCIS